MVYIQSKYTSSLHGEVTIPGDKSISHRSLILGSCANGITSINNLLESEDVFATLNALQKLGIKIVKTNNVWKVFGNGLGAISGQHQILDLGNSGTGARLLMGLVAGSDLKATFTGDKSLSHRPMGRIIEPLLETGAEINSEKNTLPLTIFGSKIPLPITYHSKISSAQVKSAVLIAGLTSTGITTFYEPIQSRDHTERMLNFMGAKIKSEKTTDKGWKVSLEGLPNLRNSEFEVPNDPSSAAFPIVSALILPKSDLTIKNVCINKLRTGFIKTLVEMGGNIKAINKRDLCGENVADLKIKSSDLHGINIPSERAPTMIDEYPIISVAACFAKGKTIMNGIKDLRNKETDRIKEVVENLNRLKIKTESSDDKMSIQGIESNSIDGGIEIDSKLDHRIAMSFLCLGLLSKKPITVKNAETINSSFPKFCSSMRSIGAKINYL